MTKTKPRPSVDDFLCAEVDSVCGAGPNDVSVRWRGGIVGKGAPLYSKDLALYAEHITKEMETCISNLSVAVNVNQLLSLRVQELEHEISELKTHKPA